MFSLDKKFRNAALGAAALGATACGPQENSHTQREVQIASAQSPQQERPAIIDMPQSAVDDWHGETDELTRRVSREAHRPITINAMSDEEFKRKHPDGAIRPYEPK